MQTELVPSVGVRSAFGVGAGGLVHQAVVAARPCAVLDLHGTNCGAGGCYVQFFNSTTVPANGATPDDCVYVPSLGNFAYHVLQKRYWRTGLSMAASSTANVLTLDAGATLMLFAEIE